MSQTALPRTILPPTVLKSISLVLRSALARIAPCVIILPRDRIEEFVEADPEAAGVAEEPNRKHHAQGHRSPKQCART